MPLRSSNGHAEPPTPPAKGGLFADHLAALHERHRRRPTLIAMLKKAAPDEVLKSEVRHDGDTSTDRRRGVPE